MTEYKLKNSNRKNKRYMMQLPSGKEIHFGSSKHQNYTMHKDPKRKENYIKRHKPRENWSKSDINTAPMYEL